MEEKIENYAFISYKRINQDEEWAKNLHRLLNSWYIPTSIGYNERLNNNKRISPTIRDKDNFIPGNDLDETIKSNLRQSRSLILILSKAMIEDQKRLISEGKHAYIFEEIEYFKSLGRPEHSIIPVNIDTDDQHPLELISPMLMDYSKLTVNVKDYRHKSKKKWFKQVAASVAAGIFQKDRTLFWDYHRKAVRRSYIKIAGLVLLTSILFIGIPLLFLLNRQHTRTRVAESYGLIEKSQQASKIHDTQAALIFALEAYEKSPDLDITLSNLRQQAIPDVRKPRTLLKSSFAAISPDAKKIAVFDTKLNTIKLLRTNDFSEIETIGSSFMPVWRISFSHDSRMVGISGTDSLWIYDSNIHKYIYREKHRKFLLAPYGDWYYRCLFTPNGDYFMQILNDCIIRLNIKTMQSDTTQIKFLIKDFQMDESELFLGIDSLSHPGLYSFDWENFRLNPIHAISETVKNNWIFHGKTSQIAYTRNDSIYRESPGNKIFCGIGKPCSFEPNGNRLLWRPKMENKQDEIFFTDSNGFISSYNFLVDNNDKIQDVNWTDNGDILLSFNQQVRIIEAKYPYKEKYRWYGPGSIGSSDFVSDSLLLKIPESYFGNDDIVVYDSPCLNYDKKNPLYTFDGKFCLYESNEVEPEIVCKYLKRDSIIWHMKAYRYASDKNGWISPKRKRCVLTNDHYDEISRKNISIIKIVDIETGKVLLEKEAATFNKFLSEDIYMFTSRDSVFIADIEDNKQIYWKSKNHLYNRSISCECSEFNKICIIPDSSGLKVYDFSIGQTLFNIPLSISKSPTFIHYTLSPQGDYLLINNIFTNNVNEINGYSKISIWNIREKKLILQNDSCELYFDEIMTNNDYSILIAMDHITIYNCHSRKLISTIHTGTPPINIVALPNGNILLSSIKGVVEIDLNRGIIVEEKDYPNGIGKQILGDHYIMSGNTLIDLNTDKIILQFKDNNSTDNPISIHDSIMLIERSIENSQSRELIIPFEKEDALVRRVRQIVGKRVLSPYERLQYD